MPNRKVLFLGKAVKLIPTDAPKRFLQGAMQGIPLCAKVGFTPTFVLTEAKKNPSISLVVMDEDPHDDFHKKTLNALAGTLRAMPTDANAKTSEICLLVVQHSHGVHMTEEELKEVFEDVDVRGIVIANAKQELPLGNPRVLGKSDASPEELLRKFEGLIAELSSS